MITPARVRSDLSRLGRETAMLQATVASLTEDELRAPSLREGRSRADVVAALIADADRMAAAAEHVTSGSGAVPTPEESAGAAAAVDRADLVTGLEESARRFEAAAARLADDVAVEEVDLGDGPIPATSLVARRIAEVVLRHHDLDTTWTIEEADPDSLLNAIEAAVRALRARQAPGMTLVTEERDEWVVGDGAVRVDAEREGLLAWLAFGEEDGVEADGPLPSLPAL